MLKQQDFHLFIFTIFINRSLVFLRPRKRLRRLDTIVRYLSALITHIFSLDRAYVEPERSFNENNFNASHTENV